MQEHLPLSQETLRCKRQYEKTLKEALKIIQMELDGVPDEDFEPSTGVIATSLDMIRKASALAALTSVGQMSIDEIKDHQDQDARVASWSCWHKREEYCPSSRETTTK